MDRLPKQKEYFVFCYSAFAAFHTLKSEYTAVFSVAFHTQQHHGSPADETKACIRATGAAPVARDFIPFAGLVVQRTLDAPDGTL